MSSEKNPSSELIRARDVSGFDVWSLPSFDPLVEVPEPEAEAEPEPEVEEVPLEEVQPLTLEELESIRQEAYNEGFATGERDGFHSAQLKVRQEAEVALAGKLASLEQVMVQLMDPIADQDARIENMLVHLVEHVTRTVIQRELKIDSSQIANVLREALKLLPMGSGNIRILVNPQDFEHAKALRERHEENWRIVEDATLEPGGCRVESEHSRIDATIETRIVQAMAKLFDQMHEQARHPSSADIELDIDTSHLDAQRASSEPADAP